MKDWGHPRMSRGKGVTQMNGAFDIVLRTPGEKADLQASWARPDEEFFASGARIDILRSSRLIRYPERKNFLPGSHSAQTLSNSPCVESEVQERLVLFFASLYVGGGRIFANESELGR